MAGQGSSVIKYILSLISPRIPASRNASRRGRGQAGFYRSVPSVRTPDWRGVRCGGAAGHSAHGRTVEAAKRRNRTMPRVSHRIFHKLTRQAAERLSPLFPLSTGRRHEIALPATRNRAVVTGPARSSGKSATVTRFGRRVALTAYRRRGVGSTPTAPPKSLFSQKRGRRRGLGNTHRAPLK